MKTNRHNFESAAVSESIELIELDQSSLAQVAGGTSSISEFTVTKRFDVSSPKLFTD